MDTWMNSEWMRFAAYAAMPSGAALVLNGFRIWRFRRLRAERGALGTLSLARGLRCVLIGAATIACATAIFLEAPVLFAIGAAIGAEELLETSAVVFALRDDVSRHGAFEPAGR